MLKVENVEVLGWEHAIRGMRNPKNSWEKSDSGRCHKDLARDCVTCVHHNSGYAACAAGGFDVGQNDFDLMTRLRCTGGKSSRHIAPAKSSVMMSLMSLTTDTWSMTSR